MKAEKKILYVTAPAVFTVMMGVMAAVFAYPSLKAAGAEWRSVWVMNGPEYGYENSSLEASGRKKENWQKNLTVGTQYGEICWKTKNKTKKIPLYYGDHEKILEFGAGTYPGFGLPGQGKKILAGAHDTTYFSGLQELEQGDSITVHTIGDSFTYEITKTEIADAAQTFAAEDEKEELILYTCYPFGKTEERRTQRYLVYADLSKKPVEP
ncbi:MAG: class D sortase [Lachnospiraceae bacterium]|nr:class D sortase [Lachnospiraceae bacterium]